MTVLNLMEDLVYESARRMLSSDTDPEVINPDLDDIVAYVLNRIPPRYTTSERGILHGVLESKYVTQQKSDILFLIHEAIQVIGEGRASEIKNNKSTISRPCLPHIIGEILEESTFSVIPDLKVTLLYNSNPAEMISDEWKNPYFTNKATRGYYHFCPKYLSECMGDSITHFEIKLEHPQFISKKVPLEVDIVDYASMGKSLHVPIILMQAREGADLQF